MVTRESTVELVRAFWDKFTADDLDAVEAMMSQDVVRLGPRKDDEEDISRGRDAYMTYLRAIKSTMPSHGGRILDAVASQNGRRGFLNCIEIVALDPGSTDTIESKAFLIFDVNNEGLICLIDIFWKQPAKDISWTRVKELNEAAAI